MQLYANIDIFCRSWLPKGASLNECDSLNSVKAILVISHGFTEHIDNYDSLATDLAEAGFAVFGHDQPYHGRSHGGSCASDIPDLHLLAEVLAQRCADVRALFDACRERKKLFVVAHSMGALVSLLAATDHQLCRQHGTLCDGMAWLGPFMHAFNLPVQPPRIVGQIIDLLPLSMRSAPVLPMLTDPSDVCFDEAVCETMRSDSLMFRGWLSLGIVSVFMQAMTKGDDACAQLELPRGLLILFGSEDGVSDEASVRWAFDRMVNVPDRQFYTIIGAKHMVHLDSAVRRRNCLAKLQSWLSHRC